MLQVNRTLVVIKIIADNAKTNDKSLYFSNARKIKTVAKERTDNNRSEVVGNRIMIEFKTT